MTTRHSRPGWRLSAGRIGRRVAVTLAAIGTPVLAAGLAAGLAMPTAVQAAPWDGEWEGTLSHPDLSCSPCRVRVSLSNGLPSIRSSAALQRFTIDAQGEVVAEMTLVVAGNAVRSQCRMFGAVQKNVSIAAQGSCGNYATHAQLALRRVGDPPPSAIAALPAPPPPPQPPPQLRPPPAPAPEAAPPPVPSPLPPSSAVPPPPQPPAPVAPPPAAPPIAAPAPPAPSSPAPSLPGGFGAGTQPIRLGLVTYAIEPGAVIGRVTTGSWLASCGSSGRFAPLRHLPNTQPNAKTLAEQFERVMRGAGYTPRRTPEEPAQYVIVGKVTSVSLNFCVRENSRPIQSSGEGSVSVDWTVVALASGRGVYQTTTRGSFVLPSGERSTEGVREIFAGTFADALQRLAGDAGFRTALATPSAVAQSRSGGDPALAIRVVPRHGGGITANMNRILPSIVEVRRGSGAGTGFLVDARGYFLTNAHVVGTDSTVTLRFNDGSSEQAQVLRKDTLRDMALLKIDRLGPERAGLRPLPIRTGKLTLTEKVYAIGNPLGLSQTVTDGIVSAYRQRPNDGQDYIQASVSITFGNSGGPLLDANGNVVGVSVATMGGQLNFFIPIEAALASLDLRLGG